MFVIAGKVWSTLILAPLWCNSGKTSGPPGGLGMWTDHGTGFDSPLPPLHNVANIKAIRCVFNLPPLIVIKERADESRNQT